MLGVTAIVPTCRPIEFVERALSSVAAQEVLPVEVIVVDDSGGDRLECIRELARKHSLLRTQVLENTHAKGVSGARNSGVEHASSDLLAFLDDDDEWLPSYLVEAVARFDEAQLDLLCTDLLYRYPDETEREGKNAPDALLPELFLSRNPGLIGSNCIIRRSLFTAIEGFDETLLTLEDIDFGLRLSLLPNVRYEPLRKRLVRHYQHSSVRLCAPRSEPMRIGVQRFWELHAHRMSDAHREEFCRTVRHLWAVDEEGNFV